jgi:hypothetical protein
VSAASFACGCHLTCTCPYVLWQPPEACTDAPCMLHRLDASPLRDGRAGAAPRLCHLQPAPPPLPPSRLQFVRHGALSVIELFSVIELSPRGPMKVTIPMEVTVPHSAPSFPRRRRGDGARTVARAAARYLGAGVRSRPERVGVTPQPRAAAEAVVVAEVGLWLRPQSCASFHCRGAVASPLALGLASFLCRCSSPQTRAFWPQV